ncbi:hypothetical protein QTP88_012031 [Uroleucon formosanum]
MAVHISTGRDGEVLFCKLCNVKVLALKRFTVEQHISRKKHTQGVERQKESEKSKTQLLLTDTKKYIKVDIPNESTLRKNYVELCYNNTMQKIRDYIENKKIWVNMDEITDVEGRYVVNVIIGTLELENDGKIFLLHTDVLEKANNSTIAKIFKKVFLKAPYRVQIFKTIAPGIPLPPEPVLTRWGTWINAANYYCEHLSNIKKVILELEKNDSVAIKDAIKQVLNPSLETNLIYLKSNFGFIPSEITQLEASGMLLSESIKCIKKIESLIQKAPNKIGQTIATKMENVILNINRFKIVTNISEMLYGKGTRGEDIPEDLTTDDMTYFKYASITSVDVERSFSSYNNLLTDRRRHLLFDNIRQILIVQFNNAI